MTKFVGVRAKCYSYLVDDSSKDKTEKSTGKCVIKRNLKLEYYENFFVAIQHDNKIEYLRKRN